MCADKVNGFGRKGKHSGRVENLAQPGFGTLREFYKLVGWFHEIF